jgi:hypothetical protein
MKLGEGRTGQDRKGRTGKERKGKEENERQRWRRRWQAMVTTTPGGKCEHDKNSEKSGWFGIYIVDVNDGVWEREGHDPSHLI